MSRFHALLFTSLVCSAALAQSPAQKPLAGAITSHSGWPQAKPADVDSAEHIVGALYSVISGPAHQPRDWNRMRSLFVPDARLVPVRIVPGTPDLQTAPATDVVFLSIDDYIARSSGRMETEGFFETGTHNETGQFGNIVSVFSTYESRHALTDAQPFARGINSIQLLKDGGRYWIEQVYWDSERPGMPIPAKYLPPADAAAPVDATKPAANFAGEWTGQLEYRDYGNDERVFLPTWLSAETSTDGRAVTLNYTFDDGPAKVVRESLLLTLFPKTNSATTMSLTGVKHEIANYTVTGFDEFAKRNRGKLVLTGTGLDDDKKVDVRITLTVYRNLFTWRKEIRPAGSAEEYKFRDGYTFTRSVSPYPAP